MKSRVLYKWDGCDCKESTRKGHKFPTPCKARGCKTDSWPGVLIHFRGGHWHLECAFTYMLNQIKRNAALARQRRMIGL